ncbi:MAG: acetolactate synthase [Clostridia bacterium]|nr:acetolactate synthase [Clostridia bacterium]
MFITQISVYLENNKGTLRTLTKVLGENSIDILALSIADTTNFGIVRLITREADTQKAIEVLKENGFIAKTNDVICVAVQNQPAGLDSVLEIIEDSNISIEYMYSLNYIIGNKALIVLRLSAQNMEMEQIAELIASKGVAMINQNNINSL